MACENTIVPARCDAGGDESEGVMRKEQSESVRRLIGVDIGLVGDDAMADIAVFHGATGRADLGARLRAEVESEVARMCELVRRSDAFDVIELLRLREFPLGDTAPESEDDGSGAVIDLVALVLLARGYRTQPGLLGEASRPHEVIQELHDRAKRLLRLSSYRLLFAARLEERQVLARLAATYQLFFVGVRAHQYSSVQAKHDAALFARTDTSELLSNHLGFTYDEFVAVRDAADGYYGDAMTAAFDATIPSPGAASGAVPKYGFLGSICYAVSHSTGAIRLLKTIGAGRGKDVSIGIGYFYSNANYLDELTGTSYCATVGATSHLWVGVAGSLCLSRPSNKMLFVFGAALGKPGGAATFAETYTTVADPKSNKWKFIRGAIEQALRLLGACSSVKRDDPMLYNALGCNWFWDAF